MAVCRLLTDFLILGGLLSYASCARTDQFGIAVGRHSDQPLFPVCLIVEESVVTPAGSGVEGPCTDVGGNNGKPRLPEAVVRDLLLASRCATPWPRCPAST